jgi:4,5-DOPA dioxygenase extradiol
MTTAPEDVARLQEHPDFPLAVPTPDHFVPLLYVAGWAAATGRPVDVLVDGYAMGSLTMTSYTVGAGAVAQPPADAAGGPPPLPPVPPEETNM